MVLTYICGPFRAPTPWQVELNCRAAEMLSLRVWRLGIACICPHTNTRYFSGAAPDKLWLAGTLEMLRRCDVVLTVKGWEASKGSQAEVADARLRDIPVFHDLDALQVWAQGLVQAPSPQGVTADG